MTIGTPKFKTACQIIESGKIPSLMVSYEWVLRYPTDFAEKIVGFTQYVQPDKLNGEIKLQNSDVSRKISSNVAASWSNYEIWAIAIRRSRQP